MSVLPVAGDPQFTISQTQSTTHNTCEVPFIIAPGQPTTRKVSDLRTTFK
jgi:hypothetical protein